ncbi:MAG: hypothetical protein ACE5EY_13750 [Anaerolineae bacterium]
MEQRINHNPQRTALTNWGGVFFLLLGAMLLWLILSPTVVENWWAFFIMVPGLLLLGLAGMTHLWSNGRFPILIRSFVGMSLILFTVTGLFLFNMDWHAWWPLMIVVPGMAVMVVCLPANRQESHPVATAVTGMGRWAGYTMVLLGSTFLLDQLTLINLNSLFGAFHWWGFFILIPALGAFIQVWQLRRKGSFPVMETILWLSSLFMGSTAVKELTGTSWGNIDSLIGIWLVAAGTILIFTAKRR